MTRWLAALVCSLSLAGACGSSDSKPGGTGGSSGTGGGGGTGGSASGGSGGSPTGGTAGADAASADAAGADAASADAASVDAASSDGASPADAGAADGPASIVDASAPGVSMMITAAAGGTLTMGAASLLVPAGALPADTMISVSSHAPGPTDSTDIAGAIYDFGPSGTTFQRPAALTLTLAAAVLAGRKAVVAWLDAGSGQWFPVPTNVVGTAATGLVSHFTSFAVLLTDPAQTCPYSGSCGGSLDGTWRYSAACIKGTPTDPLACDGSGTVTAPVQQEFGLGGMVTIAAGRYTGTQDITARTTIFYTAACFAAAKAGNADPVNCDGVATFLNHSQARGWACSGTAVQGCTCSYTSNITQMTAGSVATNGNQVTFQQDGKPDAKPDEYCVRGNNLVVKGADGEVYSAVRQ